MRGIPVTSLNTGPNVGFTASFIISAAAARSPNPISRISESHGAYNPPNNMQKTTHPTSTGL